MSVFPLFQRLSSCAAAILIGFGCATVHAGGLLTIYRVGVGPGCDFATLQQAIDAGSTDPQDLTEIRMSATAANQALTVFTRNVTIDGRYSSCNSGVPNDSTRQTISGIGTDSVMRISNAVNPARQVTLRNVVIRGGGPFGLPGQGFGGGLAITGAIDVTLLNSRVGDNESLRGAGISISGGSAALTLDQNTIVGADGPGLPGNRAVATGGVTARGGGIQCVNGAMVTINDGRIRANSSTDDGGGAYISDCTLMIEPRPAFTGAGFVTFFQNTAGGNGGGLYADAGSDVFWRSMPVGSFGGLATGNSAQGRGGAVFLTGLSNFVGDWLRFENNRADVRGGAIAVQGTSNLILRGGPGFACAGNRCPGIFGTRGITQGEQATLIGGAIYADSGGNVNLRQQRLYDNWANVGSAIFLSGSTTTGDLRSVLIARNVLYGVGNATSTVDLISSAKIQMRYVTMAGNFRVSAAFPGIEQALSSIRANGNSATVELRNSSVWNDGVQVFRSLVGATATGSCVLAHENASFAPASIANPLYVDTTGDNPDYSLQPASPAIDRCAASGTNEADVRGVARPQDLPQANLAGPFDAGAFEFALDDVIFADGFDLLN